MVMICGFLNPKHLVSQLSVPAPPVGVDVDVGGASVGFGVMDGPGVLDGSGVLDAGAVMVAPVAEASALSEVPVTKTMVFWVNERAESFSALARTLIVPSIPVPVKGLPGWTASVILIFPSAMVRLSAGIC